MRAWMPKAGITLAMILASASLAAHGFASAEAGAGPGPIAGRVGPVVALTDLGTFASPVYTATAPGKANRDLLFVVEQGGTVRVIRDGVVLGRPFLDLAGQITTGGERGLLSIAFDPGYADNGRLYAYYTDLEGDIAVSQLRRSARSKVQTKPGFLRKVIEVPHPSYENHNGGEVTFGPDGHMYLGTGDGGLACDPNENAQNPDSLLGKLLRISPLKGGGYSIPKDNPLAKGPGADEIYATGLRNPFRFSFDLKSKTISIADVGQSAWEEVDYLGIDGARGANFGWDAFEGRDTFVPPSSCGAFDSDVTPPPPTGTIAPIFQYAHSGEGFTGCAIIGGPVVRDERLPPLAGRYLFSDSCNSRLQSLLPRVGGATNVQDLGLAVKSTSSIAEGRNHRVYVTDLSSGHVFRLDPAGSARPTAAERAGTRAARAKRGAHAARIGRFNQPVYVTGPAGAGGRLFVVEQDGIIRIVKKGRPRTFLDLSGKVEAGGERGLLSVAFPPDYGSTGLFYVYYTKSGGDIVIEEYQRDGQNAGRALPGSGRKVIEIEHSQNSNHNGGQLQFGPDGLLYIGTGDGGSAYDPPENAQNKDSLLGKLLRIDPRQADGQPYTTPASNPFNGSDGANEIYALGLRNPFRFSFDRTAGALVIGDVGQDEYEEIDYVPAGKALGANFGWDAFEGTHPLETDPSPPPGNAVPPIFDYSHNGGNCSITGGYISRDPRIPSLLGRYLYADFCKGQIRSLVPSPGGASGDSATGLRSSSGVSSFGEDTKGRLYFANLSSGEVFAIQPGR